MVTKQDYCTYRHEDFLLPCEYEHYSFILLGFSWATRYITSKLSSNLVEGSSGSHLKSGRFSEKFLNMQIVQKRLRKNLDFSKKIYSNKFLISLDLWIFPPYIFYIEMFFCSVKRMQIFSLIIENSTLGFLFKKQ